MNTLKALKKWLVNGCVYFAIISLVMIFGKLLLDGSENAGRIHTLSFLLFFPFGLSMSAAGLLLSNKRLHSALRSLLHFLITVFSLFLFLWLPSNASAYASTGLIMLALFSVLYWIFFGLLVWIRSRVRKLMEQD